MNIKKIVEFFYIIYTVYILMVINTTNMNLSNTFFAIAIMWINYFLFALGYSIKLNKNINIKVSSSWILARGKLILFAIALTSVIFSLYSVNYYTGQTPISVMMSAFSNTSLYNEYQSYFIEQQLNEFSVEKIPFIFMLFFIKVIFYYTYIAFFLEKEEKTSWFEKLYLGLITISYLYFGIARGTNFEFFELLILVIFIY
ncbi:MAG TPA: hypothetical protein DHV55_01650, partial [Clostridiaceae bacterium]|nr:hypothetical protein [Clostridiaceae bacterium]